MNPVSTASPNLRRPSPTIFGIAASLLAHRWSVLGGSLVFAAGGAVVSFLLPIRYSATAAFYPETHIPSSLPANLAGIASQFGLSVGAQSQQGTDFYVGLLSSRWLLTRLLETRFPSTPGGRDSVPLLSLLKVRGRSPAEVLENGVLRMRSLMQVSIERRTGVAAITVAAPRPDLAADLANECVRQLDSYNLETRRSQAHERRRFVEGRVTEVNATLTETEDSLRRFYEANRQWQNSPRLRFDEGRLNRRVQVQQDLLLSLMQDFESAKIAEVNDVPVITVVDQAVPPTRKSWPRRRVIVVAAWLLSFMTLSVLVIVRDYRDYFVEGDPAGIRALQEQVRRFRAGTRRREAP